MDCFFIRCVKPVCMARVFADLDRAEEACWLESLEEDGVRCVAVRPPLLKDETGVGIEAVRWLRRRSSSRRGGRRLRERTQRRQWCVLSIRPSLLRGWERVSPLSRREGVLNELRERYCSCSWGQI